MQINYEFLSKNIDPQDVLRSMFSFQLISLEQKEKIKGTQQQRGKEDACEEMLDTLFKNWKRGTCERFIQVLEKSNYKECAAQLESNYVVIYVFVHISTSAYLKGTIWWVEYLELLQIGQKRIDILYRNDGLCHCSFLQLTL